MAADRVLTTLTGWGRTAPTVGELVTAPGRDRAALHAAVKDLPARGGIARGLGRSYGDPAQNGGGAAIRLTDQPHEVVVDAATATATVPGGISLDQLLRVIVPLGFFIPVSPGTRFVTVGGAIASDIHGKNHHVDGSFGNHVRRLSLLLADGSVVELSPEQAPELFWATIGGMGLTGVILDATVGLLPIETSRCSVDTERAPDLEALLTLMDEGDRYYRYSVAWIDLLAQGEAPRAQRADPWRARHGRPVAAEGRRRPAGLWSAPARRRATDRARAWPRQPPHDGGLQRVLVPQGASPASGPDRVDPRVLPHPRLRRVLEPDVRAARVPAVPVRRAVRGGGRARRVVERLASSGTASFLAVLKRFGDANPAPLSFPRPGWTLALDLPAGAPGLATMLHGLDDIVLDAGGRHYLAKDAHTTPTAIRRGYPRLGEWRAVRDAVDPAGTWASDQSRRLRLLDDD